MTIQKTADNLWRERNPHRILNHTDTGTSVSWEHEAFERTVKLFHLSVPDTYEIGATMEAELVWQYQQTMGIRKGTWNTFLDQEAITESTAPCRQAYQPLVAPAEGEKKQKTGLMGDYNDESNTWLERFKKISSQITVMDIFECDGKFYSGNSITAVKTFMEENLPDSNLSEWLQSNWQQAFNNLPL